MVKELPSCTVMSNASAEVSIIGLLKTFGITAFKVVLGTPLSQFHASFHLVSVAPDHLVMVFTMGTVDDKLETPVY